MAATAERETEEAAGGVVFRRGPAGIEVVIAEQRDRITRDRTVRLPKGKLDPGEGPEAAALREVAEETGLTARIVEPLPELRYRYRARNGRIVPKRVRFYLMEYTAGEPAPLDGEMERVLWCPIEEGLRRLTYPGERSTVEAARRRLAALYAAPGGRL